VARLHGIEAIIAARFGAAMKALGVSDGRGYGLLTSRELTSRQTATGDS